MKSFACVAAVLGAASAVAAVSIAEINGNRFLSSFKDQNVTGVTGLVTAVASNGIYLRSTEPDDDPATSEGLFVFGSAVGKQVQKGDVITLGGLVQEYRSNNNYIYLTELTKPANIVVVSSGNQVKPLVIGVDTLQPPNKEYSSLDKGGVFGVPNAVTTITASNPVLDPTAYGLDFWESLVGELVTIQSAHLVSRPNQYGDVWVRGNYTVTGINGHGGLTMLDGGESLFFTLIRSSSCEETATAAMDMALTRQKTNHVDANPEAIVVGSPLDGSKNPTDTKMGDYIGDVTGVVYNAFGTYRVLPLTAVKTITPSSPDYPATSLASSAHCSGLTVADYNAENLAPNSTHLPSVVSQIVTKLRTPDLIFLQEVQDNSGPVDDGVTSANLTLSTLTQGIEKTSGVRYDFVEVAPVDGQDGGQPGGNIRCAYLYRPDAVELYKPNPGGSNDENAVVDGPSIKYNPGRIGQSDANFEATRKPLVAMWKPVKGPDKVFFTINVHFSSKGGSTGLHGDPRPPVNKGVEKRTGQMELTANFIAQILAQDPKARIITAGDFNEFTQVQPVTTFASKSGLLDADEVAGLAAVERYTYLFDQNSEALDHMYISRGLAKNAQVEHLHLNTWQNYDGQTSDHDPSVAKLNFCAC
ncbi:uncharacterized protein G6M90_00g037850 [Metarhizium brunneum]|uniref:Endonuclease/exonuclease/phosphatase domain-containing protein n=1 Tax=Metarhizium brunneum TaxID=500148 RepID=A0A7D5UUB4_9HYPO